MKLSVIIAAHNATPTLGRCLEAFARSTRPPDETIIVDDGSNDDPAALAAQYGARLIRLDAPARGPAYARNAGAQQATGDVLVFVDADVAVHADTLALAEQTLSQAPDLAACFGSYDDAPSAPGLVSQYRNLLHHYVHQHSNEEARTFWAGCGAIRKDAFEAIGGFGEGYDRPCIEDIEMGTRLNAAGLRVRLVKAMQCTHLKRWTFARMIRTDIRDRAVPWTRVLVQRGELPNDLNLRTPARWSAVCALALAAILIAGFWRPPLWLLLLPVMGVLLALNADLYAFFVRVHGYGFAFGAILLHWLYYLYSGVAFGIIAAHHLLARYGLPLLLLATLANNMLLAVNIPPLSGPDERYHFLIGQAIERFGGVDKVPRDMVSEEVGELWSLVGLEGRVDQPWTDADRQEIADRLAAINSTSARHVYVSSRPYSLRLLTFPEYHPPLYHILIGAVQWAFEGSGVTVRVLANRFVSATLGVLTVLLIYQIALLLWPDNQSFALCTAAIASFHRRFTLFSVLVSNMALEITLYALVLYLCVLILRRGNSLRRLLALGVALTLGLLTRVSFAAAVPIVGLLFLWQVWEHYRRRGPIEELLPWLFVALIPLLGAGWWYLDIVLSGAKNILSLYGTVHQTPQMSAESFITRTRWRARWTNLLLNYWGPDPRFVTTLLVLSSVGATVVVAWWIVRRLRRPSSGQSAPMLVAVALCGLSTVSVDAFFIYIEYRFRRDMGGPWGTRPAYYLAPFAGQMLCYGLGWALLHPRARRWLLPIVATSMLALQGYLLISQSLAGPPANGLLQGLERAALLQPLGYPAVLALFIGYVLLSGALLLAIWSTKDRSSQPFAA